MVLELVVGFLVLVAASYVGTTMALRGFFGRERYGLSGPRGPGPGGRPSRNGDSPHGDARSTSEGSSDADAPPGTDDTDPDSAWSTAETGRRDGENERDDRE